MNEFTTTGRIQLASAQGLQAEGVDAYYRKDFSKSIKMLREAVRIRRQVLQEDDPVIIENMELLSSILLSVGKKQEAKDALLILVRLKKSKFGPYHIEVETSLEKLWRITLELESLSNVTLFVKESQTYADEIWKIRSLTPAQRQEGNLSGTLDKLMSDKMRRGLLFSSFGVSTPNNRSSGTNTNEEEVLSPRPQRLETSVPKVLTDDSWYEELRSKMLTRR